jgi:hypothetical protein
MATPVERFSLAGPQAAPLTGALEEVQEGEIVTDERHDHIRRVDINGRIHFAGARYYAGSGLERRLGVLPSTGTVSTIVLSASETIV